MALPQVETRVIGGHTFQIRTLPFAKGVKVYAKLQRLMAIHEDEVLADTGVGLFMFAGLAGLVDSDDLELFVGTFGSECELVTADNRTLVLSNDANRSIAFAGAYEDMFAWLDACVEVNFKSVMGKLVAARKQLELNAAKKKATQG